MNRVFIRTNEVPGPCRACAGRAVGQSLDRQRLRSRLAAVQLHSNSGPQLPKGRMQALAVPGKPTSIGFHFGIRWLPGHRPEPVPPEVAEPRIRYPAGRSIRPTDVEVPGKHRPCLAWPGIPDRRNPPPRRVPRASRVHRPTRASLNSIECRCLLM